MVIDDKLIQYLEDLSRLHLTEEEKEKSKEELGKILNYVDMLNELDTTGVEEMSHPFNFTNNFREDEAVNTERHYLQMHLNRKMAALKFLRLLNKEDKSWILII